MGRMNLFLPHARVRGEEAFVDEGAGDVEAVWLYQCRGGASVFRTGGHYVGFVVDLQGAA